MKDKKHLVTDVKKYEFKKAKTVSGKDVRRFTNVSNVSYNDNVNHNYNENEENFPGVGSYIKKYIQGGQSSQSSQSQSEQIKEKHKESKESKVTIERLNEVDKTNDSKTNQIQINQTKDDKEGLTNDNDFSEKDLHPLNSINNKATQSISSINYNKLKNIKQKQISVKIINDNYLNNANKVNNANNANKANNQILNINLDKINEDEIDKQFSLSDIANNDVFEYDEDIFLNINELQSPDLPTSE